MKLQKLIYLLSMSVLLIVSLFANAATTNANNTTEFTPEQTKGIESIVHDYLVNNPEVMLQVFQKLQQKQQEELQKRADEGIQKHAKALFAASKSPVVGNKNGNVTLVEFFDYQCRHCKDIAPMISKLHQADPNLRIIYKELPIFPGSDFAAEAALASQAQGKFRQFHEALMKANNPLTKKKVIAVAKSVGLDIKRLQRDMKSKAISDEIQQNLTLAQEIGIQGTPSFVVSNAKIGNTAELQSVFVPGVRSQEALQSIIDAVKNGKIAKNAS